MFDRSLNDEAERLRENKAGYTAELSRAIGQEQ